MKEITLHKSSEVEKYISIIKKASRKAKDNIDQISTDTNNINFIKKIKYEKIGFDPLNPDRNLNLIEQVNQTFTYLASLKAAKFLFNEFKSLEGLRLNLGTSSGSDIESFDGTIKAEVFAATRPSSNQKLKKDIAKVKSTSANNKYVFFACPGIEEGPYKYKDEIDVIIWSLGVKT
jgi:hypothetical protein